MKYFVFVSMLKRKSVYSTPKNGLVYSLVVRCDDFSSSGKKSPGKNFASLLNFTIFLNLQQVSISPVVLVFEMIFFLS